MTNKLFYEDVIPEQGAPFVVRNYFLISLIGLYFLLFGLFALSVIGFAGHYFFTPVFNESLFFTSLFSLSGF